MLSNHQKQYGNNYGSKGKYAAIAVGAVAIAAVVTIAGFGVYYSGHWYPNSKVCGVDVSGMTFSESVSQIRSTISDYKITVKGRNKGEITLDSKQLGLSPVSNFQNQLQNIYQKQHDKFFLFNLGSPFDEDFKIASCQKDAVRDTVSQSVFVQGSADYTIAKPVNAKIVYSEQSGYAKIQPEMDGNTVRPKKLTEVIVNAADECKSEINIADEKTYPDVYKKAKLTKDNKVMNKLLNQYNGYVLHWLKWKMPDGTTAMMAPKDLQKCVTIDQENQTVTLNKENLSKWVEAFCLKYKTVGGVRKFKTHDGKVINVAGGDYGWQIDYLGTVQDVENYLAQTVNQSAVDAYIKKPSAETRKALTKDFETKFAKKGYVMNAKNKMMDYDTKNYSEVDLTQQRVFVYRNGKQVYSCVTVTGLSTDPTRATKTGVYDIKDKKPEYTMRGADYVTETKFWVRIMWTGTGYHYMNRSDWGSWSPALHNYKGSHGCMNLQYNDAKNVYDNVHMGDPVFIHN